MAATEARDAMLYEPADEGSVHCKLCGHRCTIAAGKYGRCSVRENVAGALKTHSYGRLIAMNADPIEKKPLFHFLPGSMSMSVAAPGCNFQCPFCQNWQISQAPRDGRELRGRAVSPERIVDAAESYNCASISYTYTEPTVFFEMAYETARIAHRRGLGNCFVSNGYLTPEAVETIAPYLDAINVDLKAFRDGTYRDIMKARLEPVLTCLRALVAAGIWVEVTTLVVPGMNDSEAELRDIAQFIADELGPAVPWHVSRFHGDYDMTAVPPTPLSALEAACRLGRKAGLKYVYCGNVHGRADESTHCPNCAETVLDRRGFLMRDNRLADGACPDCGEPIEGVWSLAHASR
ncbi:MAG: AmmeMemoRadiSam system radical SAM enzyme [Phycisphaerae bacterium]|nr:AmmeMemoRadiSam system radical SAM enzyme [Phycisphaerae bacterium]